MSWIEFQINDISCPHCGHEQIEHSEFNLDKGDMCGVTGPVYETECESCFKFFYWQAFLNYEFNSDSYKERRVK